MRRRGQRSHAGITDRVPAEVEVLHCRQQRRCGERGDPAIPHPRSAQPQQLEPRARDRAPTRPHRGRRGRCRAGEGASTVRTWAASTSPSIASPEIRDDAALRSTSAPRRSSARAPGSRGPRSACSTRTARAEKGGPWPRRASAPSTPRSFWKSASCESAPSPDDAASARAVLAVRLHAPRSRIAARGATATPRWRRRLRHPSGFRPGTAGSAVRNAASEPLPAPLRSRDCSSGTDSFRSRSPASAGDDDRASAPASPRCVSEKRSLRRAGSDEPAITSAASSPASSPSTTSSDIAASSGGTQRPAEARVGISRGPRAARASARATRARPPEAAAPRSCGDRSPRRDRASPLRARARALRGRRPHARRAPSRARRAPHAPCPRRSPGHTPRR